MHTSTKLLIYLAVWRRPYITEICFRGIERLKKHTGFSIEVLAVISEESMIPLCEKYDVRWIMHENNPLGAKKNAGLQEARKIEFDYLMEIGSDTLILNDLLDMYTDLDIPFVGVGECAFIDSDTLACRYINSRTTYGGGRMIRRDVLEQMDFKLWDDKLNRGLDNNSIFRCSLKGIKHRQFYATGFPMVIDLKSDENIWPFNYCTGREFDATRILEKLSGPEIEMINAAVKDQYRRTG